MQVYAACVPLRLSRGLAGHPRKRGFHVNCCNQRTCATGERLRTPRWPPGALADISQSRSWIFSPLWTPKGHHI